MIIARHKADINNNFKILSKCFYVQPAGENCTEPA